MKKSTLYYIWAGIYALCALLSLLPNRAPALQVILTLLSLGMFVPPLLLLLQKDKKTTRVLLWISAGALGLSFLFLLITILTAVVLPKVLGTILHYLLFLVSMPAAACNSYALGLFLWGCVLFGCLTVMKDQK